MPAIRAVAGPGDGPCLVDWPLLVWIPDRGVWTEDGRASVGAIEVAHEHNPDHDAVAAMLHTSPEHVRQALTFSIRKQ